MFQDVMNADEYSAQGYDGNMDARFGLIYCKFTVILDNFIFAKLWIWYLANSTFSRNMCKYGVYISIMNREFKFLQTGFRSQNREIKNTQK